MRGRITTALAIFTSLAFPGAALATTDGPVISEFETGLTAGVGLWGIAPGPDGNLWFTEETHNAVGRVTPGAVITEFTAGFPTGSPRGIVTGPDGNLWVAMAGGDGAIARVTNLAWSPSSTRSPRATRRTSRSARTATSGTSTARRT